MRWKATIILTSLVAVPLSVQDSISMSSMLWLFLLLVLFPSLVLQRVVAVLQREVLMYNSVYDAGGSATRHIPFCDESLCTAGIGLFDR